MSRKLQQALAAVGARLKRQRKHLVYELPNGKNVVVASTPSDFRAENNAIREIQKVAGVVKPLKPMPNTNRRDKPGRPQVAWSRSVLAEALAPIAGPHYLDRIAALEDENRSLATRGDRWCLTASDLDSELAALRRTRWVRLGIWLRLVKR